MLMKQKNHFSFHIACEEKNCSGRSGLILEVVPSDYEEDMSLKLSNAELAKTLALGKAKAVADKFKKGIVIGADTFVVYGGKESASPKTRMMREKCFGYYPEKP